MGYHQLSNHDQAMQVRMFDIRSKGYACKKFVIVDETLRTKSVQKQTCSHASNKYCQVAREGMAAVVEKAREEQAN